MKSYLIYHPKRTKTELGKIVVYHDRFGDNEDPYLWNDKFLHTYCHITQLKNDVGQINFWVSDAKLTGFSHLYCDCVFVIAEKHYWKTSDFIDSNDPIVDNKQAFEHNYKWANPPHSNHPLKKRQRYTLKADPIRSFQPQDKNHNLIDVVPFLTKHGISIAQLHQAMISRVNSRPFKLPDDLGEELYNYLFKVAAIKLKGSQIAPLHPRRIDDEKRKSQGKCC